jgi:hypothetical protein
MILYCSFVFYTNILILYIYDKLKYYLRSFVTSITTQRRPDRYTHKHKIDLIDLINQFSVSSENTQGVDKSGNFLKALYSIYLSGLIVLVTEASCRTF